VSPSPPTSTSTRVPAGAAARPHQMDRRPSDSGRTVYAAHPPQRPHIRYVFCPHLWHDAHSRDPPVPCLALGLDRGSRSSWAESHQLRAWRCPPLAPGAPTPRDWASYSQMERTSLHFFCHYTCGSPGSYLLMPTHQDPEPWVLRPSYMPCPSGRPGSSPSSETRREIGAVCRIRGRLSTGPACATSPGPRSEIVHSRCPYPRAKWEAVVWEVLGWGGDGSLPGAAGRGDTSATDPQQR
jgi:hypothetical protein